MKLVASVFCLSLVACASAQKPEPVASTSLTSATPVTPTSAEQWAEKKVALEVDVAKKDPPRETPAEALDPLATSELEESSIPKTEMTPAKQVRAKTPRQLNLAMGIVKSASSVDGAAKKLTQRLGKPNWTEAPKGAEKAKRRVWVAAPAGPQCHRLILEADGSVEVETATKTEWRMLTASARQNPCSGEIKRGLAGGR